MFTLNEVYDGEKTYEEYYAQFKTAKPELGEKYVQHPNTWQERFYEIIFMDDKIAVGKSTNPFNNKSIEYELFYSTGYRAGWRYCDIRKDYRLQDI